jgi:hypothetical protein
MVELKPFSQLEIDTIIKVFPFPLLFQDYFPIFVGRNPKQFMSMAKYSYKQEEGKYLIYKDEKPLSTPHGVSVSADTKELATKLVEALSKRKGYKSASSILTYHYTYSNLAAQYDLEFIANDFSNCVGYDALMNDDYLMFRQPSPVRQTIATYFEKALPERFHMYNYYQLSAVLVVHTVYWSWMLSHYIITDICEKLDDEDADYETLKEEFMDDLEEFECDELGGDPDDKEYMKHLKEISNMIDVFVYYFWLGC